MSSENAAYFMILGYIHTLSKDNQDKVWNCKQKLETVLSEFPEDIGDLTLAVIGAYKAKLSSHVEEVHY